MATAARLAAGTISMELLFEIGNAVRPRGHALIYFKDGIDPERVGASYVVLLPVSVDMTKYVPPFLAGQMEAMGNPDMSSFAFPPAPEPVPGARWIHQLAEDRGDDLIYGGVARLDDTAGLMGLVGEIATEYGRLYKQVMPSPDTVNVLDAESESKSETALPEVDDVVYSLMREADMLAELTRLMGRLRYAVEGGDKQTALETEAKIRAMSRHMPDNRQIDRLADASISLASHASELAQLYLERAYGLLQEDYIKVQSLDKRIAALKESDDSAG